MTGPTRISASGLVGVPSAPTGRGWQLLILPLTGLARVGLVVRRRTARTRAARHW